MISKKSSNAVSFDCTDNLRPAYRDKILAIIDKYGYKDICDLGGGANPLLSLDDVKSRGLNYTILDISSEELEKAPSDFNKCAVDLCSNDGLGESQYDVCFSNQLIEHIPDADAFHNNVFNILKVNGRVFHLFPTLYAPPFLINYLLPESLAFPLVNFLQKGIRGSGGNLAKFPAYYNWCRGPSKSQIQRFENVGFDIVSYVGLFGHAGYYDRVPLLKALHLKIATFLTKAKFTWLTSFAYLELTKLGSDANEKV